MELFKGPDDLSGLKVLDIMLDRSHSVLNKYGIAKLTKNSDIIGKK